MASHAHDRSKYYVPDPSWYPFALTAGLVSIIVGVWGYLEEKSLGIWPVYLGGAIALVIIFNWFKHVIAESEGGAYNPQVDRTFRMGMMWFIFSEVMFFGAFFGALFYARQL
jgi:cytochrome c oxidase subunit 3